MHPQRLTVWCGLWHGGIIGPYFFRNEAGVRVTVNGDRYRTMLTEFLWPELDNIDISEMWFQQDGATCHTSRATMELLEEKFGEWIISRNGFVNWPPRSCDLTPLDFFLWGYHQVLGLYQQASHFRCPSSQYSRRHCWDNAANIG